MGNEYTLVWQRISPGTDLAKKFGVDDQECFLPFYISGHDHFKLLDKQDVELTHFMLMLGILFAYNDESPDGKLNHDLFIGLLSMLFWGFHKKSIMELIFDNSKFLREEHSLYPSYKVLKNGMLIIPTNDNIKCDFILSVWDLIYDDPQTNNLHEFLNQINDAFANIDFKYVSHDYLQLVVYINFVALLFLKKDSELDQHLINHVNVVITNPTFKNKIKFLLENNLQNLTIESSFLEEKPHYPHSIKEAILMLMELIPKDQLEEIKTMPLEELPLLHRSLGMFIRNKFGLWAGNESLMKECDTSVPDNASSVIIKAFYNHLKNDCE